MDISNNIDIGNLRFSVTSDSLTPVPDATIEVSYSGDSGKIIETLYTDSSGNSENITLNTPPIEYSLSPQNDQPYSLYNAKIIAPGYNEQFIADIQLLPSTSFLQTVRLTPGSPDNNSYSPIVIDAHTLWEYFPPKIAEAEVKPLIESGEIVLNRVVVPETIVVHDGVPTDNTASNYYVPYLDYIKNVACCEIYSTWPEATIQANVLAIMSFTLNRVFTEWYRNIHLFMVAEI